MLKIKILWAMHGENRVRIVQQNGGRDGACLL